MRIILADPHAQSRWAVELLLGEEPGFTLVGQVDDAPGLLKLAGSCAADLVLMDRDLPGIPIETVIDGLHAIQPPPIVVVMSTDIEHSRQMLKAGADAFVSKADQTDWLLDTLHKYANQINRKKEAQKPKPS